MLLLLWFWVISLIFIGEEILEYGVEVVDLLDCMS